MIKKGVFILFFLFLSGAIYAQSQSKERDSKEQSLKKEESKKSQKNARKTLSFGEMAEDAGKRIWGNVKGFFSVVAEDMIDKKDRIIGDNKKEKSEDKKKEGDKEKSPPKTDQKKNEDSK